MVRRHAAGPLVAALALVAGCGGSTKSSSQTAAQPSTPSTAAQTPAAATGPPLTKAQLIASADPICARLSAVRYSHKIRSRLDYLRVSNELSSEEQRAIAEMERLSPPASLAATWNTMLANYRTVAADVARVGQLVAASPSASVTPLVVQATQVQHQTATLARRAGFKDCSKTV